ncbi:uncharacterized protein LOC131931830 isoform X2 [Physella acuta]|nr:uncharacterized protein LOC131931830 isoform X2 [Physella acuta]XP_059144673.1 uncharacterized protein LOC131931830 isoform X2 [Physella acuta]XP_059144674.1 uncharacterized protein LOC131931830 isoform X2 [Physella acuta]XP_059144675.1 uncharacterized protein LOC131931830 isoform X2 [Physella acuta]XP_059144676.1 uncharacterized protein LOC131931830 isoform X2 [Physella acuta]XP_059144677.1 uncharacterized protein LOC131931830 isoform X2 [Physella acuta]
MAKKEYLQILQPMLAQTLFKQTLHLERIRQAEIKAKLEVFAKMESARSRRFKSARETDRDGEVQPVTRTIYAPVYLHIPHTTICRDRAISAQPTQCRRSTSAHSSNCNNEKLDVSDADEETPGQIAQVKVHNGNLKISKQLRQLEKRSVEKINTLVVAKFNQRHGRSSMVSPYLQPLVLQKSQKTSDASHHSRHSCKHATDLLPPDVSSVIKSGPTEFLYFNSNIIIS